MHTLSRGAMKLLFADFETYWDQEYSLRNMTPVEYILGDRFAVHGCAFIEDNGQPYWVDGPALQMHFDSFDANEVVLVTHNALFDACICAWKFGFVPKLLVDTLAVSRACLGHILRRHSLDSVANHLGLGAKGNALMNTKGLTTKDIRKNLPLYNDFVAYGKQDVSLCKGIFDKLVRAGHYPTRELAIADMVLRCAVKPKLLLDREKLETHLADVRQQKNALLASAMLVGAEKADLMSNDKFAELLVTHGVTPPRKISKLTGNLTYAFAKSDKEFTALEEHPNPVVQVLVAARTGHKSTLEESRTERLIRIGGLKWPDGQPWAPIPLRNHAAHTHRLGGEWNLNYQNLPRNSPIRRALIAPPGFSIVVGDAAQIEARGVAAISGQHDLVAQFANGEDVYCAFASEIFARIITKADKGERFVGKTSILGLGFGAGAPTLREALRVQSRSQLGTEMLVSEAEALEYVRAYRSKYDRIPATWRALNSNGIEALAHGNNDFTLGPCKFEKGSILLPNGLRLFYRNLRRHDGNWVFDYGDKIEKLYGGKLLENIIQALARIITMDAALRISKRIGEELAMQVHDELVFVVPDERALEVKAIMEEEMARRPDWMSYWPLASEVKIAKTYGDAK